MTWWYSDQFIILLKKKHFERLCKYERNDLLCNIGEIFFLENKKIVNQKLGNFRNAILRFFISEFSVLYYSQSRKLGFRKLEKKKKKFRGFRDFRGFWVFGLAQKNNWFLKLYQNIYYMIDFSVNFAVIYSH